jgi:xanthine dehydrogenase YagS FAD-binding subunit
MNPFSYTRPEAVADALSDITRQPKAKFIAGGTNLIDLMKENLEHPAQLVDVTRLPLGDITELPDGGIRLGATVTNADTAYHPLVEERYPLLSKTILAGASPQLRNMATNGGNLFQRTRCYYFYDAQMPCNKREPGTGCPAVNGYNRIHAIVGMDKAECQDSHSKTACIATHPSDMCVALAALEAVIQITGPNGDRSVLMADFHRLPGNEPWRDNTLEPGELITSIDLPPNGFQQHFTYIKLRDRSSYAFALVSVAVGLEVGQDGNITKARLAMGGVAHKPWRKPEAETLLIGQPATDETFRAVAESLLDGAVGYGHNTFKIELAKRAVVRALREAISMSE